MTAIDYVVRDGAGALARGVVPAEGSGATLSATGGQEISFNLRQVDVQGYTRDANDLVIELVDGRIITVQGYFSGDAANRLFFSADGFINEVSFAEGADGAIYGQYGPTEEWGKWSASDDLIFLGGTEVAGLGDEDQVGMLAAGLLGAPGLFGAGAAVAGAAAVAGLASGGGSDDAADESAPAATAEPASDPVVPVVAAAAVVDPFVNDPGTVSAVGGDAAAPHSVTVTGGGNPGDPVSVQVGNQVVDTMIGADGAFSATFSGSTLPVDGVQTAVVTVGGTAGGAVLTGPTFDIDTTPPALTISSGTQSTGDTFNDADFASGVTLTGSGEPGATVTGTIDGVTRTTTVASDGTWGLTWQSGTLSDGAYVTGVTLVTTDAIGNSATFGDTVVIDTVVDNFALSAGGVEGDNIVNAVEQSDGVTVSGTVEPGSTVMVTLGAVTLPATVDAAGNWQADFAAAQVPTGEYDTQVIVAATDPVGNMAQITEGVRVDTQVSTLNFNANSTASTLEGDGVVNAVEALDGITLGGQVEPGSSVIVTYDGTDFAATVAANGDWSVAIPAAAITPGTYDADITVTATDAVGNVDSIGQTIRIDTDAPDGPAIAAFTRDTTGLRSIQTEGDNDYDVTQVASDGTVSAVGQSETYIAAFDETLHAFNANVPDGSDLVVTATDDAGNQNSTYIAMDDETPGSTLSLANPALGAFQIGTVDLQFAEDATLTLTEADVAALSSTGNTLTIEGGSDDTVQISGATVTGSSTANGQTYTHYQVGNTTLIVDSDITLEEPPVI